MNTFNIYKSMGLVIGIIVGIILVMIIMRVVNKNRRFKTEYDEMQKQIRGDGYRVAFFAAMIYEAVLCVVSTMTELPAVPLVVHFSAIALGVTIQAGYCIWKGAYVGLNTRMNRFIICMVAVTAVNMLVSVMAFREGAMIADGKLQDPAVNLFCALMFCVLAIIALLRKLADREVSE